MMIKTEVNMTRLLCAVAAVVALASVQVQAEQPEGLTWQTPAHGGMMLPSASTYSSDDAHQPATDADKSDELGVPYYHHGNAR